MNRNAWRNTTPSASYARGWWQIAVAILFSVATLSAAAQPAGAQDDLAVQGLGYSELYLETGSPPNSPAVQGPVTGNINLNTLLGADRFYNAGFTGTRSVMANIEAGRIWNGHETLTSVNYITNNDATTEFDRHATWVGMIMGGRTGGANPGDYQRGMAYGAQLDSGAIATFWPSGDPTYPRFTGAFYFNYNSMSTFGPYRAAFYTGVPAGAGMRPADVINSSWAASISSDALSGTDNLSGTLDAYVDAYPRTLLTFAAGNSVPTGEGPNRVPSPGSAYNNLTVAALGSNGGAYDQPSFFTNGGPNDYYDPVHGTVSAVRQVVDIAAPGENFATAYYGGESGGNGPGVYGPAGGPAGGPNYYSPSVRGTSFAAPTVAGGAALLYDAAYAVLSATPDARDSRVMKAVLMNSADRTQGWDNGQTANPNGLGGVLTTRGLDDRVGAGRMDLNHAYDQLLSGTKDVPGILQGFMGGVKPTGWDFGQVNQGITNDYLISSPLQAGSTFAATLTWFRDRILSGTTNFADTSFDNLDLELWSAIGASPQNLISASNSVYNNTEHFVFGIPTTGDYMLRVRWAGEVFDLVNDPNISQYGLAWSTVSVPEPTTFVLLVVGMAGLLFARPSRVPCLRGVVA